MPILENRATWKDGKNAMTSDDSRRGYRYTSGRRPDYRIDAVCLRDVDGAASRLSRHQDSLRHLVGMSSRMTWRGSHRE